MKSLRKIMALLIAMTMVMGLTITAFAATGDHMNSPESTISAENLNAGDSIGYIQLVEWDAANSGWKLTAAASSAGLILDDLLDGITEAEASAIATALKDVSTTAMTVSGETASATDVAAGLYYLRAVPGENNTDTIYNPAFVSADYYEGGNVVNLAGGYSDTAVLKKSSNTFDKDVNAENKYVSTKPGDVIPYIITTKIPAYGHSYTNPKFTITDTLSAGLQLDGNITVTYGSNSTTGTNDDVTITPDASDGGGFTVDFNKDYLLKEGRGVVDVTITYSAKVTTNAAANVTPMDNKAELKFSHTPSETETKDDITRHYTYSIDGTLLGGGAEKTKELIKTGTDKNGNPITKTVEYYNKKEAAPLTGATFELKKDGTVIKTTQSQNGYITFNGLEAGVYTLEETQAPGGFVKDSRVFTVTITPTYDENTPDLLVSYEITITSPAVGDTPAYSGGATFAMTNDGSVVTSSAPGTDTSFINNTQGTELPSTGGIGTTIFYIVGGILVAGAAIILIAKRKTNA